MAATSAARATRRSIRSTPGTFSKLQVAWRFKTDILGARPDFNLQTTPLMINGVLYATAGSRRDAVAIDAATGELLWMYRLNEDRRATASPRPLSGRGVAYWTDGSGDERIFMVTMGYQLVALNAKTGVPIQAFGQNGHRRSETERRSGARFDHR
jgi:quinoprotein glucose dehydrogenase